MQLLPLGVAKLAATAAICSGNAAERPCGCESVPADHHGRAAGRLAEAIGSLQSDGANPEKCGMAEGGDDARHHEKVVVRRHGA